jgi:hypothetical protein
MNDLSTGLRLITATLPILGLRLGLSLLMGLALAVYLGVTAVVGVGLWHVNGLLALTGVGIALVVLIPIYRWLSLYVLYLAQAAHVAVMTELLTHGQLPAGASQLEWGKAQVGARFRDTSALFVVHELIRGAVSALANSLAEISSWLPIDGLDWLVAFARGVLRMATSHIDQAILSRAYVRPDETIWVAARDGLVLHGMCWKSMLKQAVLLTVLSGLSFVVFLLGLGLPAGIATDTLPIGFRLAVGVGVLVAAFALKGRGVRQPLTRHGSGGVPPRDARSGAESGVGGAAPAHQ